MIWYLLKTNGSIAKRAVPKAMHFIWSCWPMTSQVVVSGMAVEVEPSCQYSITFCCCAIKSAKYSLIFLCHSAFKGIKKKICLFYRSKHIRLAILLKHDWSTYIWQIKNCTNEIWPKQNTNNIISSTLAGLQILFILKSFKHVVTTL